MVFNTVIKEEIFNLLIIRGDNACVKMGFANLVDSDLHH